MSAQGPVATGLETGTKKPDLFDEAGFLQEETPRKEALRKDRHRRTAPPLVEPTGAW